MSCWLRFGLALGLVFELTGFTPAEDQVKSSEYFPLKIGTTWHFKSDGQKLTMKVIKHEKLGDVFCAQLEMTKGREPLLTEHVAVRPDGLYRYALNDKSLDPPMCFLRLPPKKGDKWRVAYKFETAKVNMELTLGEEEIKVPAGTYKTIVASTNEYQVGDQKVQYTMWYAKGIGIVKAVQKNAGKRFVLELEKFEAGK
jgi:hypothetical protein